MVPFKKNIHKFLTILLLTITTTLLSQSSSSSPAKSTEQDRKNLSITIYNGGIGLVRESRTLNLQKGKSTLQFEDVASSILPQTVRIKSSAKNPFSVFEQNYEYDLISNNRLLEKYVGKDLTLITTNPKTGEETSQKAKLVAFNDGPVFLINNQISLGHPGRILVPSIPENLFEKPTLIWDLFSDKGGLSDLEVSYQTAGMNWSADYIINLNESETTSDMQSWVTLSNSSGVSYKNATLQLVAGKVQLLSNRTRESQVYATKSRIAFEEADSAPSFEQENLSEYYLYTLDQPTDIRNMQTKQVQLFSQDSIKVEKRFIFENLPLDSQGSSKRFNNAKVRYDIHNSRSNKLGRPLPSGTTRIFKSDSKGRVQLLGEDTIDHTPDNEWIRVSTGEAFDIVGNLIQTNYQSFKVTSGYKASYEAELKNRKKESITVRFYVSVRGEWKITDNSHKFEKESQTRVFFDVKIPAGKVEKITYTVETKV